MEIIVKRDFLEHLLRKVGTVLVGTDAESFLRSFLLELDVNVLKVARTDTELSAIVHTDKVKVISMEVPTQVLIEAERFGELVPKLDGDEVRLLLTKDRVSIEAGSYKGSLKLNDLSKYPSIAVGEEENVMKLDAQNFVKALERVNYAASRGQIQDNLKQLTFVGGRCWASNGSRYQEIVTHLPKGFQLTLPIIALELIKFIRLSGARTVEFEETGNFYFFKMNQDLFSCKHSHVPVTSESVLLKKLNEEKQGVFLTRVGKLKAMVNRISLTTKEVSGEIHFEVENNKLTLSAEDEFKNKSQETFPINLQGNKKEVRRSFDMKWLLLLEALQVITDESVLVAIDKEFLVLKSDDSKALVPMVNK